MILPGCPDSRARVFVTQVTPDGSKKEGDAPAQTVKSGEECGSLSPSGSV
jgi:hypothetical protein